MIKIKNQKLKIIAIDLFCSVGGLTNGLEQAGVNVVAGYDIDRSVEHAYSKNNKSKFILKDVTDIKTSEIIKMLEKNSATTRTLIAGCAPCQPYSIYQRDKSDFAKKLHRGYPAFENFARIVKGAQPDYVTMENVRGIAKDASFKYFVQNLKDLSYEVSYEIVNAANYGAPQNRNRLVLIASKHEKIIIPKKTIKKIKTVKEAIGHLQAIDAGQVGTTDALHTSAKLSFLNIKRINASKPGGTWDDWPKQLLPDCYKKKTGQTFKSVYGRLNPNKPANTLTTQFTRYGTGRYGHYSQSRALTLREGAILQTFPENYDFGVKILPKTKIAVHIGNAVPPVMGKMIGNAIMKSLEKNKNSNGNKKRI